MTLPGSTKLLAGYALFVLAACLWVRRQSALDGRRGPVVASVWKDGELVLREVLGPGADTVATSLALERAAAVPGAMRVDETVLGTSAVVTWPDLAFSLSFVSGHDGATATLGHETVYVTVDDLLARQAYDQGHLAPGTIGVGVDAAVVWGLLADRLHTTVPDLRAHATVRRARFARSTPGRPAPAEVTPGTLTAPRVREGLLDAARYLARGITDDGRYRYLVDATSNRTLPGYDWPRHAGTTYFLAQAAAVSHETEIASACLRAAALLRDSALVTCGDARCIGSGERTEIGSTALAVLAFVEIVRTGLDPTYAALVAELARFLRASQRADGEFMHEYDRTGGHPIDVQYIFYSGEAAFALGRAHRVTHDPADLDGARRGLAHLVGPAWSFFGNRYFFGEEHWTCQAMAELWERTPDRAALDFCVRWNRYGQAMQYELDGAQPPHGAPGQPLPLARREATDAVYDADGAYGVGPMFTPRLTPVASRSEAGAAILEVLRQTDPQGAQTRALEAQLRRSLALLLRRQLRPGPSELFREPSAVYGAIPSSEVDLALRIDYAQHAGSAMARWLGLPD